MLYALGGAVVYPMSELWVGFVYNSSVAEEHSRNVYGDIGAHLSGGEIIKRTLVILELFAMPKNAISNIGTSS